MMLHRNLKARAAEKAALAKAHAQKPLEQPKKDEPKASKSAKYTKDEIEKFPFLKLKSIAVKEGLDVTNKKASEIREELIKEMGL